MKDKTKTKDFTIFIKKYLPDIIIIIGIWIFSYNVLMPPTKTSILPSLSPFSHTNYHTNEKVFGILLVVIGTDVAIRRYLNYKNHKNEK